MVVDRIWLALFRHLASHRWQTLLSVLAIMLGVAVVVAVDLANQSISQSFELSMQQIAGRSTHRIIGGPEGIDERFYTRLRVQYGLRNSAPVVEGNVRLNGESFNLLGLDPLAEAPFRSWILPTQSGSERQSASTAALITRSDAVMIAAGSARRLGLSAGDVVSIQSAGIPRNIWIAGLIGDDQDKALQGLLVADIATAQELLGQIGRLDRIDLILDGAEQQKVLSLLPAGLQLVIPENRNRAVANLSKSFETNLTAMSLLALLVGGFLIYNAMSFSVLQRRSLFALMRMIGVTRAQLFTRILLEALTIGVVGSMSGLLAGACLGQGLVRLVARTVNDLYFTSNVSTLLVQPGTLFKGLALGLVVTLVASFIPALEAAGSQPQSAARRSVSEQRTYKALPGLLLAGVGAMLTGFVLVQISGNALLPGFTGLFFLIVGFCLMVPALVLALSTLSSPVLTRTFGFTGKFAARSISASLSRTGLAIAALTMAVAATIGMGIMVESFRATVASWLSQSLQGDLYISIPESASRQAATALPNELITLIQGLDGLDGIDALSTGRRVQVETGSGPMDLLAIEMAPESYNSFRFKGEPLAGLWNGFHQGDMVLISEPYAVHQELSPGDSITLLAESGQRQFTVGGVFHDYGSDRGVLVMQRQVYARLWQDRKISTIGVYFTASDPDPGSGPDSDQNSGPDFGESVRHQIESWAIDHDPRIRVRSNGQILQHSLHVFDRTFTITRVLRLLVILVAFVGILSALMALQFERARENAVLRASGFTRSDLITLTTLQTGLMGLFAGLLALPLGWLIGQILIHVINLRSFGWTLDSQLVPAVYIEAIFLAIGAALVAGLYPGFRMSRASPAAALREE